MIKTRKLHTFSMITNVKSYTFSRIRIKNSCANPRIEMRFVKYLLLFASLLTKTCQNDIPRFWTTFLFSGPPLFSFLSSSSFCKDTMNILISQEKMGDNIKKVAILFVISDFCSIFAYGLIRPRAMTSVFVDEIDFVSSSMKF